MIEVPQIEPARRCALLALLDVKSESEHLRGAPLVNRWERWMHDGVLLPDHFFVRVAFECGYWSLCGIGEREFVARLRGVGREEMASLFECDRATFEEYIRAGLEKEWAHNRAVEYSICN